jgi:hypothetical protein
MKRLKSLILLLSLLAGLVAVIPAMAQDDDTGDEELPVLVEVEGTVAFETVEDDDEITVGGVVIAPAGAFNPADLTEGDLVLVTGYLLNDDTVQAIALEVLEEAEDEPEATPEATEEMTPEATEEMPPEATEEMTPEATEEVAECVPDSHPVANALAEEFEMDVATIVGWHCGGFGFGEIARALLLAEGSEDTDAQAYLDMKADGMGWGQIMRESDMHPSELAPGRVIGGGPPDHAGPPEDRGRPDHAGPPDDRGRPDHAGPPDDRGRPDHAGPPDNRGGGNGNGNGNGRGGGGGRGR